MAGLDRTGPAGMGAKTGGQKGAIPQFLPRDGRGRGFGRGVARGRGFGFCARRAK